MPGPWINLPRNPDYYKELSVAEGGYIELEQFDGDGQPQGTALWQIDHMLEKKKEGLWLNGRLAKGPGKAYKRSFVSHLCLTPAGECRKTKRHREKEFHSDTFRDNQSEDILARRVAWFSGADVKDDIDREIAALGATAGPYDPAGA